MKRPLSFRSARVLFVFVVCLLLTLAYFPIARIFAAPSNSGATVQGTSKTRIGAESARYLNPIYSGKSDAVVALKAAAPVSLTTVDLDADGAPDLIAGYTTAKGGVVIVTRGNPDAFAPTDATLKKLQGKIPDAVLSKASVFAVPVSPDLMVTGDFNRDAKRDVLVAARGGAAYLLAGDGKGNLLSAKPVPLVGAVTAMAASADGHVAVSLETKSGWQLAILNPSAAGFTAGATYPLPARGDSLAWGNLGGGADIAVGAGTTVVMIYAPLGAHSQTETVNISYEVHALALGDFIWDRDGRTEVAILARDGSIQILQHGTLDTRPLTTADARGRRAAMMAKSKQSLDPTSLGAWSIAKQLPSSVSASSAPVSVSSFSSPRLAPSATHDLMVIDSGKGLLKILDTSSTEANPRAEISFPSAPVAAVALPQKFNGERDLVVLSSGKTAAMLLPADSGDPTFNVTTTNDEDDAGACPSGSTVTSGTGPDGVLSLREAICEANNNGGTDVINVPAGTYSLSISTEGGSGSQNDDAGPSSGEIQVGTQSGTNISIVGAEASSTIIQQTNGSDRVFEQDPPFAGGVVVQISDLTIENGDCNTGLDCGFGGGGMLGTGNTGDNLTLMNVTFNTNTVNATANGGALASGTNGDMTINTSAFSGNIATGGIGGALDFDVGAGGSGNLSVTNSSFTNNTSTAGSDPGEGGAVVVDLATGSSGTISGSTFTGNQAEGSGSIGGAISANLGTTVSNSRIVGNSASTMSGFVETGGSGNTGVVIDNWWGCNAGPGNVGCDSVGTDGSGSAVTFNPWLVLSITANPTQILPNTGTSTLTADLTHDSGGNSGFSVPDGTPVSFAATLDSSVNPASSTLTSGQATSVYTAGSTAGSDTSVTATVDNATASTTINILDTVIFNTSPTGLSYTVDGVTYTTQQTFNWVVGSTHSVSTTSPQAGPPGSQYVFSSWSNSGTQSQTVIAPASETTYTAFFSTQYQLTTAANPSGDGTVSPTSGNYYSSGTVVPLTATANAGFNFSSWTGPVANPSSASTTVTMTAPAAVTANFSGLTGTTTGLVSSANASTFGGSVTFTATVTSGSGTPTGNVSFENGTSSLGTIKLVGGKASLTTSALSAGSHTITAQYNGSTKYAVSSATLTQTVNKVGTTTTITNASPNPSTYGQSVIFTATVTTTAGTPSGKVVFKRGTVVLGSGTLSGGTASYTTTTATQLPGGADAITAVYNGDNNHVTSTSAVYTQTVDIAATTTSLGTSGSPSTSGNPVTFTATVSSTAGSPQGNVVFRDGTTLLGTVQFEGGTAQFTTSALTAGTHTIHAHYQGTGNYAASTAQVTQLVNP
ncbi:MAG: Ig-like domain repeat protein [Candidatus Sulfotelmatobacter sp.]